MMQIFGHLLFSLFVTGLLNLSRNHWPQDSYAGIASIVILGYDYTILTFIY